MVAILVGTAACGQSAALGYPTDPSERKDRHVLRDHARELFQQEQLVELEDLIAQLRSEEARFRDGSWRLTYLYAGLYEQAHKLNDAAWNRFVARCKRWIDLRPESVAVRIVLSEAMMRRAGEVRGENALSPRTTDQGDSWQAYQSRLTDAERILREAEALPESDPELYHILLTLQFRRTCDRQQFEAVFRKAIAFEPAYHRYYFAKAFFLSPRWCGERGEVEQFAAEAAGSNLSGEGDALYTRILLELQWPSRDEFFQDLNVSWKKMRAGFELLMQRYPDSVWLLNNFCRFACLAGDGETAGRLFDLIRDDWNVYVWRDEGQYRQWRRWARGEAEGPPELLRRRD